jgi:hypothetical protein
MRYATPTAFGTLTSRGPGNLASSSVCSSPPNLGGGIAAGVPSGREDDLMVVAVVDDPILKRAADPRDQ